MPFLKVPCYSYSTIYPETLSKVVRHLSVAAQLPGMAATTDT